ncbi:MAG TPA: hypothetical protein ACFYD3_06570 [Candidatus Hypogeohydataceae bacterium YC41]
MTGEELKELKRFILETCLAQGFATYMALKYKDQLPSLTDEEVGALCSELQFYRTVMSEMLSGLALHPVEEEFPEVFGKKEITMKDVHKIFEGILDETLRKVRSE